MKRSLHFVILFSLSFGFLISQNVVEKSRIYQWHLKNTTSYDSVLAGLEGIRMVSAADFNNDGKYEILATNYTDQGHVHLFSLAGKDTFELQWSSPRVDSLGGGSTPRNVIVGDLDKDGKKEIIFESSQNGVYIYEWSGAGYNFGTKYSQLINPESCPGFPARGSASYTEKMTAVDVDNDGQQELVLSFRPGTSAQQKYMIIRANGEWDTESPGFSFFDTLFLRARPDLIEYGLGGGSAFSMNPANLDGTGNKEIVIQAFDFCKTTVLRYDNGAWVFPDVNDSAKKYIQLQRTDGVSYFGGAVTDIDKDGREEVYLPISYNTDSLTKGKVIGIHYTSSTPMNKISEANVFTIDFSSITTTSIWGHSYGDLDGNGKPNLYFTTASLGKMILSAEYQGGDKTNNANWIKSVLYYGDSTNHALTIKDSAGVIDTIIVNEKYFPSKVFCNNTDLDGDGIQDMIAGYQPWDYGSGTTDSVLYKKLTWNGSTSTYDTTESKKIVNTKRYGFVILSKSALTGVEARNLVFITPEDYKLNQNYPNPFNPSTSINFVLPLNKKVSVKVFDILGKEVRTLINNEEYIKGSHTVVWNGHDNNGRQVASGTYLLKLSAGNVEKTIKMMMLK